MDNLLWLQQPLLPFQKSTLHVAPTIIMSVCTPLALSESRPLGSTYNAHYRRKAAPEWEFATSLWRRKLGCAVWDEQSGQSDSCNICCYRTDCDTWEKSCGVQVAPLQSGRHSSHHTSEMQFSITVRQHPKCQT